MDACHTKKISLQAVLIPELRYRRLDIRYSASSDMGVRTKQQYFVQAQGNCKNVEGGKDCGLLRRGKRSEVYYKRCSNNDSAADTITVEHRAWWQTRKPAIFIVLEKDVLRHSHCHEMILQVRWYERFLAVIRRRSIAVICRRRLYQVIDLMCEGQQW